MKYVLIITASYLTNKGYQAFEFTEIAVRRGNKVELIYFLFDGVLLANKFIDIPQDEWNLTKKWQSFFSKYRIPLNICPASAARRGIVHETIANSFEFGSIGKLVDACQKSDKIYQL